MYESLFLSRFRLIVCRGVYQSVGNLVMDVYETLVREYSMWFVFFLCIPLYLCLVPQSNYSKVVRVKTCGCMLLCGRIIDRGW